MITFVNWAPVGQTVRVTFRLRDPVRVSDYAITLAVGQTRRVRFPGALVRVADQGAARLDISFECP